MKVEHAAAGIPLRLQLRLPFGVLPELPAVSGVLFDAAGVTLPQLNAPRSGTHGAMLEVRQGRETNDRLGREPAAHRKHKVGGALD